MDHCNRSAFCSCFLVLAFCTSSLVRSFSVVMEPSDGFKEYSDVFFTGTVVSLHCTVSEIDIDDANVTVYFNDTLIAVNGVQLTAEGLVTRNAGENAYRLQRNNVTLEHRGYYTCKVQSQKYLQEDSFFLNVVSDSPQCITRCNEYEKTRQLVCYSRQLQQYFKLEESQNGSSLLKGINNFSPFNVGNMSIAPLNVNYQDTWKTYKCSVLTTGNSLQAHNRSCYFDCRKHNAMCRYFICPPVPLTIGSHFTTKFPNSEQIAYSLPLTLNPVSFGRISTDDGLETTESQALLIGLSALCCTLIIVLIFSCIVVCCVLRKSSWSTRNDQSTTTAGASADQSDFRTNTPLSFVTPEQSKNLDKHEIPTEQCCSEYKQNIIEANSFYNDPDKLESLNATINDSCQNLRDSTLRPYEYIDFDLVPAQENKYGPSSTVSIGDVTEGKKDDVRGSDSASLDQTCDMIDNIVYDSCSDTK